MLCVYNCMKILKINVFEHYATHCIAGYLRYGSYCRCATFDV